MNVWTEHRYVVADVEGNGHQPPDLVELAVVPIERGVIGELATWLFQPDQPITPMARRIHGISNHMVASAPIFASLATDVQAHLDGAVLVAHNASVDLGVLQRKLPGFAPDDVLDTLRLARRLLPDQPNHRLGSLVSTLDLGRDLPSGLRPHRAGYDALVTARLFVYLTDSAASAALSFEACAMVRETVMCSSEGLFISVDGPSGVGKSDTVRALSRALTDEGRVVHVTCEPSDGPIGKLARELTDTVHGTALACMYAADRYQHLDIEILPHLEAGEIVVTDRYIPSALVMQQLDGVDPDYLWRINAKARKPDLAVILDADPLGRG